MTEDGEDDLQDATSERQDPIFATPPKQNHRFGAVNPSVEGVKWGVKGAALRDARWLSKTSS